MCCDNAYEVQLYHRHVERRQGRKGEDEVLYIIHSTQRYVLGIIPTITAFAGIKSLGEKKEAGLLGVYVLFKYRLGVEQR